MEPALPTWSKSMPDVDFFGQQNGRGRSAGNDGLEIAAAADAACNFVDHFFEVVAHGQLVDAGALDVAADAEEPRAAVARRANGGVGCRAHVDDVGHGGDGLGVVDDRGTAVEADDGREGRLDAGNAALAFERLHERRFFADFVGARAGLRDDLEFGAGAEDVLAQKAAIVGVGDGALHDFEQIAVLAAQVDEAHLRADGEAGDDGAFNDSVRIVQKDQVIFAGAGLAFVAIDEDVLGLGGLLGNEGPLHARREARAAAAAQAAGLHLVDDPFGALGEALLHGLIAAEFEIAVDVRRAHAKAAGDDLDFIGMGDEPRHSWPCASGLRLPAIAGQGCRAR